MRRCNASSACFSSQPLATGCCKLQVQIPLLLTALTYAGLAARHVGRAHLSTWDLAGLHLGGYPVARFDGRGAANHSLDVLLETNHSLDDVLLEGAVRADGYFFETGDGPGGARPGAMGGGGGRRRRRRRRARRGRVGDDRRLLRDVEPVGRAGSVRSGSAACALRIRRTGFTIFD